MEEREGALFRSTSNHYIQNQILSQFVGGRQAEKPFNKEKRAESKQTEDREMETQTKMQREVVQSKQADIEKEAEELMIQERHREMNERAGLFQIIMGKTYGRFSSFAKNIWVPGARSLDAWTSISFCNTRTCDKTLSSMCMEMHC